MDDEACRKSARPDGGGGDAVDRLSNLPDALLHSTISCLKARQVVQTSVLSKRWRYLWHSVPCLDIDEREFLKLAGLNWLEKRLYLVSTAAETDRQKFVDFTDNVLARRNGSLLDTFQLRMHAFNEWIVATRWIRLGLKCSPKVLLFQNLDSHICVAAEMPNLAAGFFCLRKLHLQDVRLHGNRVRHISSACPLLEDLELKTCHIVFHEITFPALKKMVLSHCTIPKPGMGTDANAELSITAPHLSHLHVDHRVGCRQISINTIPSLVKASIRLNNNYKQNMSNQWQFLRNLFNVTNLELSGFQKTVMPHRQSVEFPTFRNLRSLLLYKCDLRVNFQLLALLLQNSPNLEKLIVHSCKFSRGSSQYVKLVDLQCRELKSTKIMYKNGDNSHRELVNVLLDVAEELPKNTIALTFVPSSL